MISYCSEIIVSEDEMFQAYYGFTLPQKQNTKMTIQALLKYFKKTVKSLVMKDHKFCDVYVEQLNFQQHKINKEGRRTYLTRLKSSLRLKSRLSILNTITNRMLIFML